MPNKKVLSWIIIVLTIALIARLGLFLGILLRNPNGFFLSDSETYWQLAENIINHNSFSRSIAWPLVPEHNRTPLYPLFIGSLRLLGLGAPNIVFVQIFLSSATCLIVILLTYKLVGSWYPACLAGGIIAVDIPSIVMSNALLTETLFTFILTLSVLYLVFYFKRNERTSSLLISGTLMGLAMLCRPIALFLPFFITVLIFLFSKQTKIYIFRRAILYFIFCFLVVFPWLIRNQIVFGSPFLSTIGSYNLLYCRAGSIYAVKEGITLSEASMILNEKVKSAFHGNIEEDPIRYKNLEAKVATSIILAHPFIYMRNVIVSVINMLFKPSRGTIELQLGFTKKQISLIPWGEKGGLSLLARLLQQTSLFTVILVIIQLFMLAILWILFSYGMTVSLLKKEYLVFWIIALVMTYFCLVSAGPEAYARFRVPIVPFLAIGSGIGLANVYERLKSKRK